VYLGRISYGLYILHPFMPGIVERLIRFLRLPSLAPLGPTFVGVFNLFALIAACSLSWHFFEKKINNLKRFFPYVSPTRRAAPCAEFSPQALQEEKPTVC